MNQVNEGGQTKCACWSRSLAWDFVLPLGVLVFLTLFMALDDRELEWSKAVYDAESHAWSFGEKLSWRFLYHAAPTLIWTVVLGSAVLYVMSYRRSVLRRHRRVFLYLILVGVIAPGMIAHYVFKDHWGRPRPREITEFGGKYAFESVLTPDWDGHGKSFVSGHAAGAFYFVAGWFVFRRQRRSWAWFFLIGGIGFGCVVGYMRMLQGGHFASDVLWGGAVTYFTAAGLYYLMGLNRTVLLESFPGKPERLNDPF